MSKLWMIIITLMMMPVVNPTVVGVTYSSSSLLPPPQRVVALLQQQNISAVRIPDPSREIYDTNISVFLSVPNSLVPLFSETHTDFAKDWIFSHVVSFYKRVSVTGISLGDYTQEPEPPIETLTLAIQNTHKVLKQSGIYNINVSTSLSYTHFVNHDHLQYPSDARFKPNKLRLLKPLLRLITQINSSFFVTVYPYVALKRSPTRHPLEFALFQKSNYVVRDPKTSHKYLNMFDFMIDSVYRSLEVKGFPDLPVIVTETGWPCLDASCTQASAFVNGLIKHVKTVDGTPSRKDDVPYVYIYKMFDGITRNGYPTWNEYGMCYPNMTMKFHLVSLEDYRTNGGPIIAPWKINAVLGTIYWIILCSAFCIKRTQILRAKEEQKKKEVTRILEKAMSLVSIGNNII